MERNQKITIGVLIAIIAFLGVQNNQLATQNTHLQDEIRLFKSQKAYQKNGKKGRQIHRKTKGAKSQLTKASVRQPNQLSTKQIASKTPHAIAATNPQKTSTITDDELLEEEIEDRAEEIAQEIIEDRREERFQHRRNRIKNKLTEVSKELNWSEEMEESVTTMIFGYFDQHKEVREDVDAGEITREEAREEHHRLHEEGKKKLEQLIGADDLEVLQEKMWGHRKK